MRQAWAAGRAPRFQIRINVFDFLSFFFFFFAFIFPSSGSAWVQRPSWLWNIPSAVVFFTARFLHLSTAFFKGWVSWEWGSCGVITVYFSCSPERACYSSAQYQNFCGKRSMFMTKWIWGHSNERSKELKASFNKRSSMYLSDKF